MIKYEVEGNEFDTKEEAESFLDEKKNMLSAIFEKRDIKIISPLINEIEYIYVKRKEYQNMINEINQLQKYKIFCESVSIELDNLDNEI
jgi:succinate dehydrogenase flavin-adding protein (antitoxin of CptAB toxin-antitoxin module)